MRTKTSVVIILFLFLTLHTPLLKAEISSDENFENFTTSYYLKPAPDEIPKALNYFLNSRLFRDKVNTDGHTIEIMALQLAGVQQEKGVRVIFEIK